MHTRCVSDVSKKSSVKFVAPATITGTALAATARELANVRDASVTELSMRPLAWPSTTVNMQMAAVTFADSRVWGAAVAPVARGETISMHGSTRTRTAVLKVDESRSTAHACKFLLPFVTIFVMMTDEVWINFNSETKQRQK